MVTDTVDYGHRIRARRLEALGIGLVEAAAVVTLSTVVSIDQLQTAAGCVYVAGLVACFVRLNRREPAGFQPTVDGGRPGFSAVVALSSLPFVPVLGAPAITVGVIYAVRLPNRSPLVAVVAPVVAVGVAAVWLWLSERRRISLTPDGVVIVHRGGGRTDLSWDTVTDAQAEGRERLRIRSTAGDTVCRQRGLSVSPVRLSRAIRHYRDHPERRAAIGTSAELAALMAVLESRAAKETAERDS